MEIIWFVGNQLPEAYEDVVITPGFERYCRFKYYFSTLYVYKLLISKYTFSWNSEKYCQVLWRFLFTDMQTVDKIHDRIEPNLLSDDNSTDDEDQKN